MDENLKLTLVLRISDLERQLRNTENMLENSNKNWLTFYEALEKLKLEHTNLKKKYEKLKHKIQEKNLTEDFLEEFEALSINDNSNDSFIIID